MDPAYFQCEFIIANYCAQRKKLLHKYLKNVTAFREFSGNIARGPDRQKPGENTAASEAITISRSCIFAKPETAQGRFPVSSDENFSDQSFRQGGTAVLLSDPENSDIPHSISDN